METPEKKFLINISEREVNTVHTWITEEQKNFIERFLSISNPGLKNITVEKIVETVCTYLNVELNLLPTRTRLAPIVYARQVCFYFFVKELGYSTARAGRIFFRDHATVLHALAKLSASKHQKDINEIASLLNSQSGLFAYESNGGEQTHLKLKPPIAEI